MAVDRYGNAYTLKVFEVLISNFRFSILLWDIGVWYAGPVIIRNLVKGLM